MADSVRVLHQFGGLPEVGACACGVDQRADLPAADDGAGEHGCTGVGTDGQ